ncbi:MAG TPA: hypothetical protein VGM58_07095 [Verrucomicrobiae bacterium]|jgi:hypothetical protein
MHKLGIGLILILLFQIGIRADDRTMHMGIYEFFGNPPAATIVSVTTGSVSNQTPSSISFYVEYSDDLQNWKPLPSFALGNTDTDAVIATNLTNGQMALFFDENASSHRFYRAVETQ